MALKRLDRQELRDMLITNWMTHDALWYGEVAVRLGMAEASPMNLRVCRKLGRIELKRLMEMAGASAPRTMQDLVELFELGREVFVPQFMDFQTEFREGNCLVFHIIDCFAHRGMQKAGVLPDYECGIFERIEGWLDTMGVNYALTPDLSRCLKFKGEKCEVRITFSFE